MTSWMPALVLGHDIFNCLSVIYNEELKLILRVISAKVVVKSQVVKEE